MTLKNDCLFCRIIEGEIVVPRVYEDESHICIRDIHPQAKVHLLVIPKVHIASLADVFPGAGAQPELLSGANQNLSMGNLFEVTTKIARDQGLLPGGFRSVINTGAEGGQSIFHLHLHLLGGEPLRGGFA